MVQKPPILWYTEPKLRHDGISCGGMRNVVAISLSLSPSSTSSSLLDERRDFLLSRPRFHLVLLENSIVISSRKKKKKRKKEIRSRSAIDRRNFVWIDYYSLSVHWSAFHNILFLSLVASPPRYARVRLVCVATTNSEIRKHCASKIHSPIGNSLLWCFRNSRVTSQQDSATLLTRLEYQNESLDASEKRNLAFAEFLNVNCLVFNAIEIFSFFFFFYYTQLKVMCAVGTMMKRSSVDFSRSVNSVRNPLNRINYSPR